MRLVFPEEFVPNIPVILPQGRWTVGHDLKLVKRTELSIGSQQFLAHRAT
jgi:hypothetical protein